MKMPCTGWCWICFIQKNRNVAEGRAAVVCSAAFCLTGDCKSLENGQGYGNRLTMG